jgi:calcium-translocating P-type ATPase
MYDNPSTGWIEGSAILAACTVVSVVTATNDYQKETQFRELNQVKEDVNVLVVRDRSKVSLSVEEIVVGDVICLEAGDSIPCDGVLLKCDGLEIDESALTGEPIDISKDLSDDPFVLSGCTATAGTASLVAIAVGKESQWGIIKAALEKEQEQTPLQFKLDRMAEVIGHVGMASAVATFIAMMAIKLFVQPAYLDHISTFSHALDAFIIGVTIVVVAVPEGLPLAVTISLAYSTKKMLKDKNLIRHLQACETMGNATNICSDKTGTLTQNRMTVVTGNFANVMVEDTSTGTPVPISDMAKEIILQGIATCSTATLLHDDEEHDETEGQMMTKVIGNKTEASLLLLAESKFLGQDLYEARRVKAQFGTPGGSRMFPFSSKRKCMSVLVNNNNNNNDTGSDWTLHHKGAGEIVLGNCTHYLESNGSVSKMTSAKRFQLEQTISEFASRALRCVALAHRVKVQTIANFDPETASVEQCAEQCESNMVLDALFGIVDPLRPDVVEAVKTCQRAGIFVRMVTGDNLDTAKAIAKQAGILSKGEVLSFFGCDTMIMILE